MAQHCNINPASLENLSVLQIVDHYEYMIYSQGG